MRAAIFNGKSLEIKEIEKPSVKPYQVLIKVINSGICGTDISIIKGHLPTPTPIIPGHEFCGIVEEVGKNVDSVYLGKKVAVEINSREGRVDCDCYFCSRNNPTNCLYRKAIGIDINGAFAEYIAVDFYLCHILPDHITFEMGTFIEPLAASVNTFELTPLTPQDKFIAIYGGGKMGQLIAQVIKSYDKLFKHLIGSSPYVVLISRTKKKLDIAKENGADLVINSDETDPVAKIKELTNGIGADIVVECTGNPDVLDQVVASTRTRGKIALKSTHGLPVPINMTDIVVRELTLYASRCGPFEKAISFLASDLINLDNLITARVPLSEINKGFEIAQRRETIKVIIENQK